MKTKKIEQNWLTKKIWFGKSFYALVCGFALALAGWSYFLVSAGDIQIQTDIDNAVQTIREIIVTSDGTSNGDKYFDFNPGWGEAAFFKYDNIPSRKITQDLWIDNNGYLVKEVPANVADDWDWVMDGNAVYKTWNVAIGAQLYPWKLSVISSTANLSEIYVQQDSDSPANITFDSFWEKRSVASDYRWGQSLFYIWVPTQDVTFYMQNNYTAGINSNFTISWSLDMKYNDINNANIVNAVLFVQTSDKELKENLQVIKNPLDKIYALNGYTFDWKKDGSHDVGLIAQEVEKVLPQLVHVDTNGHKWVQYSNMVALLIEWLKELGNKVDGLYNKYLDQQDQIKDLELRIERLENK